MNKPYSKTHTIIDELNKLTTNLETLSDNIKIIKQYQTETKDCKILKIDILKLLNKKITKLNNSKLLNNLKTRQLIKKNLKKLDGLKEYKKNIQTARERLYNKIDTFNDQIRETNKDITKCASILEDLGALPSQSNTNKSECTPTQKVQQYTVKQGDISTQNQEVQWGEESQLADQPPGDDLSQDSNHTGSNDQ